MSPESTPTIESNKAQAIVDLNQDASYSEMSNEQYEARLAAIDATYGAEVPAAEAVVSETPTEVEPVVSESVAAEADQLLAESEASSVIEESSDAAAIYADQQRAAAMRAIEVAGQNWDQDRIDSAKAEAERQLTGAGQ